ncbi:hypothetical protein Dsin_011782 [Dipteronia sinensis]|uniref:RNase H type-1 domain-containing protein n=1 Tax=Dipteronia sinensis TaxID=43782 RepID=A0AAE0AI57_9ROSI|nr:hypothetical protein Dsin_011782 [Dipteronia sinensis]
MVAEMVRWRVAWWFRNCGLGSPMSPAILMLNLKVGCVNTSIKIRNIGIRWCCPAESELKFNVDGSSRGNSDPAGIGGILRNHAGATLCMFSSFLGDDISSACAEIYAIHKACELCEKASCPVSKRIIIESDSKSAVSWVNGVNGVGNVRLMDVILDIRDILSRNASRIKVQFVSISGNVSVDLLAKLGALSGLVQEVWGC